MTENEPTEPEVTDPPQKVDPPKEPETPKPDPDWKAPFSTLEEKVDAIAAQVAGLAPLPTEQPQADIIPDEDPVTPPWTHKKLFG